MHLSHISIDLSHLAADDVPRRLLLLLVVVVSAMSDSDCAILVLLPPCDLTSYTRSYSTVHCRKEGTMDGARHLFPVPSPLETLTLESQTPSLFVFHPRFVELLGASSVGCR